MNKNFQFTYLGQTNHRRAGSLGAEFIGWLMEHPRSTTRMITEAGHDLKHLRWDLKHNPKLFLIVDGLTGFIVAGPEGDEPNLEGLETSEGEVGRWRQTDEGPVWERATEQEAAAFLRGGKTSEPAPAIKMDWGTAPAIDDGEELNDPAPVAEEEITTAGIKDLLSEIAEMAADIRSNIEELRDEEQEYYDNMPEAFQNGDRGQNAQEEIDAMEQAISELEEIEAIDEWQA